MAEDLEVPARLIDVLAKQMYGRAMRKRPWESGWYDLSRERRQKWLDEAQAVVQPIYREVAEDIERRMTRPEAVKLAVRAFHTPGLKEQQPIEEALGAAFRSAMSSPPTRRTLERAIKVLAWAGREIGGGVGEAAQRIGPGEVALARAGVDVSSTPAMALGVAIGLLMAGDSEAQAALEGLREDGATS